MEKSLTLAGFLSNSGRQLPYVMNAFLFPSLKLLLLYRMTVLSVRVVPPVSHRLTKNVPNLKDVMTCSVPLSFVQTLSPVASE